MKDVVSAGVVVFYKDDAAIFYLLLHYTAGHWDFPKGHVEYKESLISAALRELREETGLSATIFPNFFHTFSYLFKDCQTQILMKKTVTFFLAESESTHVTLSHEHVDFVWLSYEDALQQLTYDNAKVLLQKAHEHLLHLQKVVKLCN